MAEVSSMSFTGKLFIGLFSSYALIALVSLWTDIVSAELFWKLSVTYGVLVAVLAIIYLVRREFVDDKKMKKDKYMD